jgi:N-methylhydantoinase A
MSTVSREFVKQFPARTLTADSLELIAHADAELRQSARAWMTDQGLEDNNWSSSLAADIRYRGQAYDLKVPVNADATLGAESLEQLISTFHALHKRQFGHADLRQPTEISAIRLAAVETPDDSVVVTRLPHEPADPLSNQSVYANGMWHAAPLYWRENLAAAQRIAGPAIIAQEDATLFVALGWQCEVHESGNLILRSAHCEDAA